MHGDVEVLRTTESAADAACYPTATPRTGCLCAWPTAAWPGLSPIATSWRRWWRRARSRHVLLAELADPDDRLALDVDAPVEEAVSVMAAAGRGHLPVTEGSRVVGLVSQRDVTRALAFRAAWSDPWSEAWTDDSTAPLTHPADRRR